ncbi:MAG: hypothetical protein JWM84_1645, partial [Nocardioides sp.]|nr:hypothetical protein [Nocardioides sp.]
MKTPARLWLSAGLVLLLGSSCLMVAIASPARPEPNAERAALVVDDSFGTRASARLFQVWGTGSWRVRDGAYVLRRPAARPRATSPNRALSVLRTTVRRSAWRLETTVRSQRDEYSVLFAFRNPRNYSYVHVDRRASRSGVYVVRRGKATRLAAMTTGVRVRREHVLELRREGRELKVYVGSGHDRTFVAKADVPGSPYLRAGLGSWHSGVSFDDLRITARGAAPTAGVSPSTGPTSNPSPSAGPTAGPTSGPTAGPTAGPTPTATGTPTTPGPAGRGVDVATSAQLTAALADARPGDVITMADGTYTTKGLAAPLQIGDKHYVGTFVASAPGTAEAQIVLQGTRAAIIDGNHGRVGTGTQYGLYLA